MEEALIGWLLSKPLLSNKFATRIWWLDRPTSLLPAVTLQLIEAGTEYHHEGRVDLLYPRIQFDVWGKSYTEAKTSSRLLTQVLEAGEDRPTAIFFEAIEVNNRDMPTETLSGGTKVFRVLLEYLVPYKMKGA